MQPNSRQNVPVAEVYNAGERDLKKGVSDRFMSPGDIASSALLKRMGALRKRGLKKRGWLK